MAITTCYAPVMISARRGRSTTVLSLEDRDGSVVDLVFTSLAGMEKFSQDLSAAVTSMIHGDRGSSWRSVRPSRRRTPVNRARINEQDQRTLLGVLNRMGLLDRPFTR